MAQLQPGDPYNLQRFVDAQASVSEQACDELRAGSKQSHWMWFIFPQIKGLGSSPMAIKYAISSREEAQAYLVHPILGPRLIDCSRIVVLLKGRSISAIFAYPDDLKFYSSMTLFAHADREHGNPQSHVFQAAVDKYFAGKWDRATLDHLRD